jgi:nucleoside-diphosphate-sugar epimerase
MLFTILGGSGFIGRHLARRLRSLGYVVQTPPRGAQIRGWNLGHVIYAIGTTGNHRQNPGAAIDGHVDLLRHMLADAKYDSWLYLSSARVYGLMAPETLAHEETPVPLRPSADAIFDLSKLLGESVCLAHPNPSVRIVRLSNVYGADQSRHTFLGAVMAELARTGQVTIQESPESSKDYISIDDVVELLPQIAVDGEARCYNVVSGEITTHGRIAETIKAEGYEVSFAPNGATRAFPQMDNSRLKSEFPFVPLRLTEDLPRLLARFMQSFQTMAIFAIGAV